MLKAQAKPAEQPDTEVAPREIVGDLMAQLRDEFLPARCVVGASESDYLISVRAKYVAYRQDAGRTVCGPAEFEEALTKLDGVSISGGRVRGPRLKRSGELVADAMTAAEVGA